MPKLPIAATGVLLALALTVGGVAATSYTSSFYFDTTLTGAARSYNYNNMSIYWTSNTTGYLWPPNQSAQGFKVSLYRQHDCNPLGCANDLIGTVSGQPYVGPGRGDWINTPGPGNYWFFFSKPYDGVILYSNSVVMFSH
jgi:hypothetical protein